MRVAAFCFGRPFLRNKCLPYTRVEIKGSSKETIIEPGHVPVDLALIVDITVNDFKVLSDAQIPLMPKKNAPQALKGENIYEDERVIILN